jgi:RNA polymerase sigma factor for flagellar operon FliA
MLNYLSKEKVQISRTLQERVRKVDQVIDALTQQLQRKPMDEEVAKATGMSIQQVEEALFWSDFSVESLEALNEKVGEGWQPVSQEESQGDVLIKKEEYQQLEVFLGQLAPLRIQAIVLRYWEDLSLKEIGEIMKKKENAVKQLLHNAMTDLRKRYGVMDTYGGGNHA